LAKALDHHTVGVLRDSAARGRCQCFERLIEICPTVATSAGAEEESPDMQVSCPLECGGTGRYVGPMAYWSRGVCCADARSMNDPRLVIRCPHCDQHIEAQRLVHLRKHLNEFGIDVFECSNCFQRFKFDPDHYFLMREEMAKGRISEGRVIGAVKPHERLASEIVSHDGAWWQWSAAVAIMLGVGALVYFVLR
jgi:hypothetical protein